MGTNCDVSLRQFTEYVQARGPERSTVVTKQIAQAAAPYHPGKDFYRRFLLAVRQGRAMNLDREVVTRAVEHASAHQTRVYAELARGWLEVVDQFTNTYLHKQKTGRWRLGDMAVRVTPHLLLEHQDGGIEAVLLYLKQDELAPEVAEVMLWQMRQAGPELHSPDGVSPTVVDVRRAVVYRPTRDDVEFSAWMLSEAAAYRSMWGLLAA